MRTLLTTLALVAGMGLMAQSADAGKDKKTPEEKAAKRTEQMTKDLGLSAEQVAKVNTINLNFARYNADVKAAGAGADVKGRTEALKSKRDAQLKEVLTPEQYTKYEAIRAKKAAEKKAKEGDE